MTREFELCVWLSADGMEPAWDSLSLFLSVPPLLALSRVSLSLSLGAVSLSLSQISKRLKKFYSFPGRADRRRYSDPFSRKSKDPQSLCSGPRLSPRSIAGPPGRRWTQETPTSLGRQRLGTRGTESEVGTIRLQPADGVRAGLGAPAGPSRASPSTSPWESLARQEGRGDVVPRG